MTWTCREIVNKPINLKFEKKIKQYFSNDNNNKENKTSTPLPLLKNTENKKTPQNQETVTSPLNFM